MEAPAESERPRSRLKTFGGIALAMVVGLVAVGACVAAFVGSTPEHTLEVPRSDLELDTPRFYPLPSFGADSAGRTFGVWIVARNDGSADAFYARDPFSGCHLPWRPDFVFEGESGWFRDPCQSATYTLDGVAVFGPTPRGIDSFDVTREEDIFIVDLERIRLGDCREDFEGGSGACSAPNDPEYRDDPPPPVAPR
jgi:hypothetical protein